MKKLVETGTLGAMAAAVLLWAGPALAATVYHANMDGASAGTPSQAYGTVVMTLNDEQTEVTYRIEYFELLGLEVLAHIHSGFPGETGPVLLPLPLGEVKTGVWPVGPDEVTMLNRGKIYVNVHTDLYPSGEIRGDVSFQSVPRTETSWGGIKALFH